MNNLEQMKADLGCKKAELKELQKQLDNFELDPDDYKDPYNQMLDDCRTAGDLNYNYSYALSCIDPIAYRCGLLDYVDGLELTDSDYYNESLAEVEQLQSEIEYLEIEIEDLEAEENE